MIGQLGGILIFHIIQNAPGTENCAEYILVLQVMCQILDFRFLYVKGDIHIQVVRAFHAADSDRYIYIAFALRVDPFVQVEGTDIIAGDPYRPTIIRKALSFCHVAPL